MDLQLPCSRVCRHNESDQLFSSHRDIMKRCPHDTPDMEFGKSSADILQCIPKSAHASKNIVKLYIPPNHCQEGDWRADIINKSFSFVAPRRHLNWRRHVKHISVSICNHYLVPAVQPDSWASIFLELVSNWVLCRLHLSSRLTSCIGPGRVLLVTIG
jgi:hypothetical protein